jgi:uncharacterized membrane protein
MQAKVEKEMGATQGFVTLSFFFWIRLLETIFEFDILGGICWLCRLLLGNWTSVSCLTICFRSC